MQWSDVTATPKRKTLRQFAGLWLLFFGGLAAWKVLHVGPTAGAGALAALAVIVGGLGLLQPAAVRWVYTGWMVAAFPIGWVVSKVMIGTLFYAVFTPVGLLFRAFGRDLLKLRRPRADSYWLPKQHPTEVQEYFRQS